MSAVVIQHLSERRELLPTIQAWFEAEWPAHYGIGGRGNAGRDLLAYSNRAAIPLGLVAFLEGRPCGFAVLKSDAFPSHPHLLPWVGAAYVEPSLRRQGIGRELVVALEREAGAIGYSRVYCATSTAVSLLERCGWNLLERVRHEGEHVSVYEKALPHRNAFDRLTT